jgi:hypothetical protein
MNFKIAVKENVLATCIIESWEERYQFDELAFIWLVFIRARLL